MLTPRSYCSQLTRNHDDDDYLELVSLYVAKLVYIGGRNRARTANTVEGRKRSPDFDAQYRHAVIAGTYCNTVWRFLVPVWSLLLRLGKKAFKLSGTAPSGVAVAPSSTVGHLLTLDPPCIRHFSRPKLLPRAGKSLGKSYG